MVQSELIPLTRSLLFEDALLEPIQPLLLATDPPLEISIITPLLVLPAVRSPLARTDPVTIVVPPSMVIVPAVLLDPANVRVPLPVLRSCAPPSVTVLEIITLPLAALLKKEAVMVPPPSDASVPALLVKLSDPATTPPASTVTVALLVNQTLSPVRKY